MENDKHKNNNSNNNPHKHISTDKIDQATGSTQEQDLHTGSVTVQIDSFNKKTGSKISMQHLVWTIVGTIFILILGSFFIGNSSRVLGNKKITETTETTEDPNSESTTQK